MRLSRVKSRYDHRIPGERKSYKCYRKQTKKGIQGIRGKTGKKEAPISFLRGVK